MHIYLNHSFNREIWNNLKTVIKGSSYDPLRYGIYDILRKLSTLLDEKKLPIDLVSIRNDEYAADEWSVRYTTGKLEKAISCLSKLVNHDLSQPSHKWESYGEDQTIMTMQERINHLKNSFKKTRLV
jgi:hypothetical protein